MLVLGLDTSTKSCTVALLADGQVLAELTLVLERAHSTRLMPLIAQLFSETGRTVSELAAIGVGTGPGSFTGLRIGLATAQALGFALGVPVYGVPSLEALAFAQGAAQGSLISPLFDARRGAVYTGLYRAGADWVEVVELPQLVELQAWLSGLPSAAVRFCGEVAVAGFAPTGLVLPRAWAVAWRAGQLKAAGVSHGPQELLPLYLRPSEAERLWAAKEGCGDV